jgi:hypothetical protein
MFISTHNARVQLMFEILNGNFVQAWSSLPLNLQINAGIKLNIS